MAINNTIFTEFENENTYRNYPFAECATMTNPDTLDRLNDDIFLDASIYPLNSKGDIYISEINNDNFTISISDNVGVLAEGVIDFNNPKIEFYDTTSFHRHVGVLVYNPKYLNGALAGALIYGKFQAESLCFAASSVCPIKNDGVLSLTIDDTSLIGDIKFKSNNPQTNIDRLKTPGFHVTSNKLGEGETTIRFDAIPSNGDLNIFSIKKIIFVVTGTTPFRIERYRTQPDNDNTALITLDKISRDIICNGVHRESNYEIADLCEDPVQPGEYTPRPAVHYELEFTPKFNCINIVSDDLLGYENPVSITFDSDSLMTSPSLSNSEAITPSDISDAITAIQNKGGLKIEVPGMNVFTSK